MSGRIGQKRMRHGITSRARAEERPYDVLDLAKLLSRPAPSCHMVQQAAMDLSDAILHLNDITRAQASLLAEGCPAGRADAQPGHEDEGQGHMAHALALIIDNARSLRVMEAYHRKARSRRDRLIKRLDHAILEARRREAEEQARIRRLSFKFGLFD
jgi:hypothetical protein